MEIISEKIDGIGVLRLSGRMDATNAEEFADAGKKLVAEGVARIIADFTDLEYISSAGLRSILLLAKVAHVKKVTIAFSGMQAMVADIFKLSGFLSILVTYPDFDAALAAMKA